METIGPYKIAGTLKARRPMYIATAKDGSTLLIKTVPLAGISEEERQRFEREAEVCATLDHPNLVRIVDSGSTPEVLYQAMPYLLGSDLSKVFASGRRLSWDEKIAIMEALCDGLAYAHGRKLVHRDIKPANLFLENNGAVRILDFGMVRLESSALTRAGTAPGTLNYMAPEQIRGDVCTTGSDVFSAGIVFHELCTGAHPFGGRNKSLPEILSGILFDPPPAWSVEGAPAGLEFVIRKSLEKDPARRWKDAAELRHAIRLCRMTLEHGQQAVAAAETPSVPVAAPPVSDQTVVIARPQRPSPGPPPAPPPQRFTAPAPAPVQPTPKPDARYCPACARPNPPETVICVHCGGPLSALAGTPVERPDERSGLLALSGHALRGRGALAVAGAMVLGVIAGVLYWWR